MNIDDYERFGQSRYARLAQVVEEILHHALLGLDGVANVPQTQNRAKDPAALRRKLAARGLNGCNGIEDEIKDLAGCRIIFYTATDLERFQQSSVWRENFDIEWSASKIHFPRSEDASADDLYQGIHYVVRLPAERLKLVEYRALARMRCEIQLQTILNHAWSETSHDLIYKRHRVEGYGSLQEEAIRKRFARVMRDYLMPAGYELQKIQSDAERLKKGQAIFDSAPLLRLRNARNNNDRYDTLGEIRDHLLPGLDDMAVHLREIREGVVEAIEASRTVPVIARTDLRSGAHGAKSTDVLTLGLNILDAIRYGYAEEALLAIIRLWEGTGDACDRALIEKSAERLARYSLSLWKSYGAAVQAALTRELFDIGPDRRKSIRPLLLVVCEAVLATEMTESEATSFDTVTFSRATLRADKSLIEARENSISMGMEALEASVTGAEWIQSWNCLWSGTSAINRGGAGDADLRRLQLDLIQRLAETITRNQNRIPNDVLQEIEEAFYWAHRRLAPHSESDSGVLDADTPEALARLSLRACRDTLNSDARYLAYKTLVGFRTVFIEEWDGDVDVEAKEELRRERISHCAALITRETLDEWVATVTQCATTESNDMATFPPLTQFFDQLSNRSPDLALMLLLESGKPLQRFAPAFFPTLVNTTARDDALKTMNEWVISGKDPAALARALFLCDESFSQLIENIGSHVVAEKNEMGCLEAAHAALKHETAENALLTKVFVPALDVLTSVKHGYMCNSYLIRGTIEAKLDELPLIAAEALIRNCVYCTRIGYAQQKKLERLARNHSELVWDMFQSRITEAAAREWEDPYEAIPDDWHGLEKQLRGDVVGVLKRICSWPVCSDREVFHDKAKLLACLYHDCDQAFVDGTIAHIEAEGVAIIPFICEVLENFDGSVLVYPICQAMIQVCAEEDPILSQIGWAIEKNGVVSGEFGMAEAYERKAKLLRDWLSHADLKVRNFADSLITEFDNRALDERRRGIERRERRRRDFDDHV